MLGEGLRQELPELFDLWARRPQLRVPRMHPALAALAGLGAQWLSRSILQGALLLTSSLTGFPAVRTFELTEAFSWALGAIVAFASGGRQGLLLVIAAAISLQLMRLAVAIPGTTLFCERAGLTDCPNEPLRMLVGSWPMAVGLVIGILGRRTASTGAPGTMGLALGAGIVALVLTVTWVPIVLFVPGEFVSPPPEALDWYIAAQVAAAATMGFVAGRFGYRPALAALAIAGAYLLSFLAFLPGLLEHPPSATETQWQIFSPLFFALAAFFGLALGTGTRTVKVNGGRVAEP